MAYGVILGQSFGEGLNAKLYVNATSDTASLTEVKATGANTGNVYNGVYNSTLQYFIIDIPVYDVYTVSADLSGQVVLPTEVTVDTAERKYISLAVASNVLNDNSWAAIRAVSDINAGDSYWAVGDAKQITINGTIGTVDFNNYNTWVYILGFNHNASLEGNNRIHFGCFRSEENYTSTNSMALVDSNYGTINYVKLSYHMNNSESNYGGWEDSLMRKTILDADADSSFSGAANSFLLNLPDDLKGVLKICTKYTDNVGNDTGNVQSNITATQDWCFLLSEFEVTGTISSSNSYEQNYQKQYQYYIDGNSKIKYRHSSTNKIASWWLRSPSSYNDYGFVYYFSVDGYVQMGNAVWPYGFAPAFCV